MSADGREVSPMALRAEHLLNRSITLFGPSGTGKSVGVTAIMGILAPHIEQVLVISPTEPSNHSYSGFVDSPLIHYSIGRVDPKIPRDTPIKAGIRFLELIWKRQEMLSNLWKIANNLENLHALFEIVARKHNVRETQKLIEKLHTRKRDALRKIAVAYRADPPMFDKRRKVVNQQYDEFLSLVYKRELAHHIRDLWERKLDKNVRATLEYIYINPRLLIVFDDCAAELKPYNNKEILRKLFYQNRHVNITIVICCQDDTDLPPNLRKNSFICVYTDPQVATTYFQRNKFPKGTQNFINEIMPKVFDKTGHPFRKFLFIREDPEGRHYYHITFQAPPQFHFGSKPLRELCTQVQANSQTFDSSNPFYEQFLPSYYD